MGESQKVLAAVKQVLKMKRLWEAVLRPHCVN